MLSFPPLDAHASRKQTPLYWDGRRVGWEDADGRIVFDRTIHARADTSLATRCRYFGIVQAQYGESHTAASDAASVTATLVREMLLLLAK